jgi:hypothetical protein
MWGKPPSFFQKLALEANEEESHYPPCEEIADDEKHHRKDVAGFRKNDVSRAKPVSLECTM